MTRSDSTLVSKVVIYAFFGTALLGCGGTKILNETVPLAFEQPLASAADERIEAIIDWIIVRDGPGTWARDADWDEYLVRFQSRFTTGLTVTSVVTFDSTFVRQKTNNQRNELVNASRLIARRYAGQGVEVKAGLGGGVLIAAGAIGGVTAVGAGAAALYMSSAAATATLGALLAAPALVASGIVKSVNANKVSNEIVRRQTSLPLALMPGEEWVTNLFFPITPSPRKVEVVYQVTGEAVSYTLVIDTAAILDGLHLVTDP